MLICGLSMDTIFKRIGHYYNLSTSVGPKKVRILYKYGNSFKNLMYAGIIGLI